MVVHAISMRFLEAKHLKTIMDIAFLHLWSGLIGEFSSKRLTPAARASYDSGVCLNRLFDFPADLPTMSTPNSALPVRSLTPATPAASESASSRSAFWPAAHADDPRGRLAVNAIRIFADKGYANASTREICAAANVNVAAIHYYFGDKAGLYRAVFLSPVRELVNAGIEASREDMPLEQAMRGLYQTFIRLIASQGEAEQLMRLHMREMLEPSGLIGDALPEIIAPHHHALVRVICRALDLPEPDVDVQRLVFSVMGMINIYCTDQAILKSLAPDVLAAPDAFDILVDRLTDYACALVEYEKQRRNKPSIQQKQGKPST
jgi:TetR/AcrR family transcriptional regulator, regulator of cefoperazone and chloramphenicol sensitivity